MAMLKPVLFSLPTIENLMKFHKNGTISSSSSLSSPSSRTRPICNSCSPSKSSISSSTSWLANDLLVVKAHKMVEEFNARIPIEEAQTPPSSWYTDPSFFSLEFDRVFYRGWQAVGFTEQLKNPHDFFTGRLGRVEFVISRDANGKLHAFHNVCRHRASLLASGSGQKSCFVCPYHGWTYGMDGALLKATKISGIQNFNINEFGLVPLKLATWGPFILINFDQEKVVDDDSCNYKMVESEWLGNCSEIISSNGIDSSLTFVSRREYTINSNWKVLCDNFIDGGYHVPYAHKDFASGFNFDTYTIKIFDKVNIQECESAPKEKEGALSRIGSKAFYAFIYPNFIINRYGPWMETNLIIPHGPNKCQVISDYFLEPFLKDEKSFIDQSIDESEGVLMEDITLCENVQRGLESPAYTSGRYVPTLERAVHHFHCLLYHNLAAAS